MEFPRSILVKQSEDGALVAVEGSSEFENFDGLSITTARYVLAGTGVIQNVAPRYVENAKA